MKRVLHAVVMSHKYIILLNLMCKFIIIVELLYLRNVALIYQKLLL